MDQDAAFLQAIIETLDDDTPRMIYADWLDEHGDAGRAEFIRIQCALADPKTDLTLLPALQAREEQLLVQHRKEWEQPLRRLGVRKVTFHRGFAEAVSMGVTAFLERAEELFSLAPIRGLSLTMWGNNTERLERVLQLSQCPHLTHLTSLDLSDNNIGTAVAEALARSPHLTHLTELNLSNNYVGATGAEALARSSTLTHLTSLGLYGNGINDKGAEALARSPNLTHLTRLDLCHNDLCAAGAEALARSDTLTNLTSLDLSYNGIGTAGAEALAQSPTLTHLTSLGLYGNGIGAASRAEIERRLASRTASRSPVR